MEIKQKHGKHALRKAVTAAVLAGTAFSSLGGFAGAVTTVKAEEYENIQNYYINDDEKLLELFAKTLEESAGSTYLEKEEKILQLLKIFPTEKLKSLIPELADLGLTGGIKDEVAIGFLKMVLEEVGRRASENDKVVIELSHKNEELKEKENALLEVLKEKNMLKANWMAKNQKFLIKKKN